MKFRFPVKFCHTINKVYEVDVKSNQAITPSQMDKLTSQGRSISSSSLESMSYHDNIKDFEAMPLENQRGIDMNIAWEASQDAKSKIKDFKRNQKRQQHVQNPTQAIAQ